MFHTRPAVSDSAGGLTFSGAFVMALIKCMECSRDISDQAATCPGCGAPVVVSESTARAPDRLGIEGGRFVATREMMAALAKTAVQACKYRIDSADDAAGTVTFTTGMTMGSWTGVSGSIVYREVAPYLFEVSGTAKQNVRGGQVVALDLFGEAKGKVENVIQEMRRRVESGQPAERPVGVEQSASTGCAILLLSAFAAPAIWAAERML